jgi:hypothetical protein
MNKSKFPVLAASLLLAATAQCMDRLEKGTEAPTVRDAAPEAALPQASPSEAARPVPAATPAQRMVVRTVELRLIVKETLRSFEAVERTASELGGYISESRSWREGGQLNAKLTLRVPADKLDTALRRLRRLAEVVDQETITGQDVTQEYVDLSSNLRNDEAFEKELLALLTDTRLRTGKVDDLLTIYNRLNEVRQRIEQIKGRMQYLEKMSALATVTVELLPSALAQPIAVGGWQPAGTARTALRLLVRTLQVLADVVIWLVIYVLPLAILIGLCVIGVRRGRRRFWPKRVSKTPPPPPRDS